MENKVTYQLNCPWYDKRNGREYEHTVNFTENELKKYREALYFTSGVRCFDKEGKLIENPFNELPHSYIINYLDHYGLFLYEMETVYVMPFPACGNKNGSRPTHDELFILDEKPYSDGTFVYPGRYEFAGEIKEELPY